MKRLPLIAAVPDPLLLPRAYVETNCALPPGVRRELIQRHARALPTQLLYSPECVVCRNLGGPRPCPRTGRRSDRVPHHTAHRNGFRVVRAPVPSAFHVVPFHVASGTSQSSR